MVYAPQQVLLLFVLAQKCN